MLMFFVHVVDVHVDLNVVDVNLNIDSDFEVVDVNDVDCIIDVLAGVVVALLLYLGHQRGSQAKAHH